MLTIRLRLASIPARIAMFCAVVICLTLLTGAALAEFVIGTLCDDRATPNVAALSGAARLFGSSGRLHARLAEAELWEADADLVEAESQARAALRLSPNDHGNTELLATILEARGDRDGALLLMIKAAQQSPRSVDTRWRLANLFLRSGRMEDSLREFKTAIASDEALLPGALDIVWRASSGNIDAIKSIAGDRPDARASLAIFLLRQSMIPDACAVFESISADHGIGTVTRTAFLNALIDKGGISEARGLWLKSLGVWATPLLWNGDFEASPNKTRLRFEWTLKPSDFAKVFVETGTGRGGSKALRLDFTSRDTPRLDDEVKQLIVVHPGAEYSLRFWVKTQSFDAEAGPSISVTDHATNALITSSETISPGSRDWRLLSFRFIAPRHGEERSVGVVVGLKLSPRFAYERPASGTIWLDDFELIEQ